MTIIFGILILIVFGFACALALIVRRVARTGSIPVTAEWIESLSFERYRPMLRILDGSDIEFLRSQPGVTPKIIASVRAERVRIFRAYLKCLAEDFGRVCFTIKLIMLQSQHDRPDLATALIRQQIAFASAILAVQFKLVLYNRGISTVDAAQLVKLFDFVRLELRVLIPASSPAAA